MMQDIKGEPLKEAEKFISEEKEVPDVQAALQGAMDIICRGYIR
jgi:transcriptional accessory protein Tex/SPT6